MEKPSGPLIVAMKGHPGTGKSTLARALAAALRCPLLDKDDVRDCTLPLQRSLADDPKAASLLNDLSYAVLWRTAETQLRLGLSLVVDSPLSRRAHLDTLIHLSRLAAGARLVVVECRAGDEAEWRRRLEARGSAGGSWHKPGTWEELRRLVEGYGGCADYEAGDVPRLVVDTTAGDDVDETVATVVEFIRSRSDGQH